MTTLKTLADAREEILKAEVAALLHNLGKLSEAFLAYQRQKARLQNKLPTLPADARFANFNYQAIAGVVAELVTAPGVSFTRTDWQRLESSAEAWLDPETSRILPEPFRQSLQQRTHKFPPPLDDRKYAIGDFIAFQAYKWYEPKATGQRILVLLPTGSRATELLEAAHDVASGVEKEQAEKPCSQVAEKFYRSTAFGWESPIDPARLERDRLELVKPILSGDDRKGVLNAASNTLSHGLGDTQWPINEVTLWDLCHGTATLFKAALAQLVLGGTWPTPPHSNLRWRLLYVSFGGVAFWGEAHHVTDLLGRRQVLEDGLDSVRDILEIRYPLGNEVYRDEHGSVFVVPDADDLLKLEDENGRPLKTLLEQAFDAKGVRGELTPEIEISGPQQGKKIDLANTLQTRNQENILHPAVVANWWSEGQRPQNTEICTVCGRRPVGHVEPGLETWVTSRKAQDRNVCGVCLHRRGRRAHDWARNVTIHDERLGPFDRTIWTDEVADGNGRFALVVGRFVLDGWLGGQLIPTMLKAASFARIHRCWDTTYQFWTSVQNTVLPDKVAKRLRWGIQPANTAAVNRPGTQNGLGRWHTYEADVKGQRLGLCWDPNDRIASDRNLFWTTSNLDYFASQAGITTEKMKGHIQGRTLALYEPGGYLGQDHRLNVDAERCQVLRGEMFHPYIPILTEPATFMALVPADRALDVAKAIKTKYETEMARVRDRLPLHLGLVFAPRRTPLAAVLEAGRAMLDMPDGWEKWQVEATGRDAAFSQDGRSLRWKYPATMGDGQTPDIWYPHLLTVDPKEKQELVDGDFALVDDLVGSVYIRPSRFDFEFLDTTARRFEIHYDGEGRRPRRTRPFYLDDLDRLEDIWAQMRRLEKSQRHQVIEAIEATRQAWFGADRAGESGNDEVFRQFVRDTLAGAAWPQGHKWAGMDGAVRKKLKDAGVAGELADLAELHQEILKEREE